MLVNYNNVDMRSALPDIRQSNSVDDNKTRNNSPLINIQFLEPLTVEFVSMV